MRIYHSGEPDELAIASFDDVTITSAWLAADAEHVIDLAEAR